MAIFYGKGCWAETVQADAHAKHLRVKKILARAPLQPSPPVVVRNRKITILDVAGGVTDKTAG
jgi:hypothetical protein